MWATGFSGLDVSSCAFSDFFIMIWVADFAVWNVVQCESTDKCPFKQSPSPSFL